MKTAAYEYLARDRTAHIDMLEILDLPSVKIVLTSETGVLLEHDNLFFLASDPGRADAFLPFIVRGLAPADGRMAVLHNADLQERLEREFGFQTFIEFFNAVYDSSTPLTYALPDGAEIRRLDQSHLDFVSAHYHTVDDRDYLRERIDACMFGIFMHGSIVGFAGTHDECSMGLMEILPEYRRLGLAYALEAHLINHLLSIGRIPFCQVSIHNEPSIRLQKKAGLTISPAVNYWMIHE
jgi:tRNA (guanine37-N1)-methyltransferase